MLIASNACHSYSLTTNGFQAFARLKAPVALAWAKKLYAPAISPQIVPGVVRVGAVAPALKVVRIRRASIDIVNAMSSTGDKKAMPVARQRERVHEIINDPTENNAWDKCWQEGAAPWDLTQVTPVIQDLVGKGQLPEGRALVPGCGLGYDVLALASESRHVVGLDISETVNGMAKQMAAGHPQKSHVDFKLDDFFTYKPDLPFNLIFDYTFFCAINPTLRSAWAAKIAELLDAEGELITLMFPMRDFEGGPPFSVSIAAYEEVLKPLGFKMVSCEDNELAPGARKGVEKIAHWKRSTSKI